jgi:hypothetical protein
MRRLLAVLSACLGACGDNLSPSPDAAVVAFEPAPHASLPLVIGHSNTVLSHVELVTITYSDYALRDDVEAFGDAVIDSAWYNLVGAEYNVFGGTQATKVELGPAPASLSRSEIEAQIQQVLSAAAPGTINSNVLYMLYVPPTVLRGTGLVDVRSFHEILLHDRVRVPIAVVLDNGAGLDATTVTAAHLLIDAATNPYDPPNDGYYADPPETDPWTLVAGEVADLCEGEAPVPLDDQLRFMVPRVYSNRAAANGDPPCKPFAPDDSWSDVTAEPPQIQTIPRGGSVTFELTGWSTRPLPDWTLLTQRTEVSTLSTDEMAPELSSPTINNNQKVMLTLHAPATAGIGATGGIYVLSGPTRHPWAVGFIVQ